VLKSGYQTLLVSGHLQSVTNSVGPEPIKVTPSVIQQLKKYLAINVNNEEFYLLGYNVVTLVAFSTDYKATSIASVVYWSALVRINEELNKLRGP
jgi:hypothetical protein